MRYLTSGQAAKICGVAPRTLSCWFDNDMIKGHRIPSKSGDAMGDRRIPIDSLLDFMIKHSLPRYGILSSRILCFGVGDQHKATIESTDTSLLVIITHNPIEFGILLEKYQPAIVVVDSGICGVAQAHAIPQLIAQQRLPIVTVVLFDDDSLNFPEYDHAFHATDYTKLSRAISAESEIVKYNNKRRGYDGIGKS